MKSRNLESSTEFSINKILPTHNSIVGSRSNEQNTFRLHRIDLDTSDIEKKFSSDALFTAVHSLKLQRIRVFKLLGMLQSNARDTFLTITIDQLQFISLIYFLHA